MSIKYENFVIGVPAVPQSIYNSLRQLQSNDADRLFSLYISEGDVVKAGDIVAQFNVKSFQGLHNRKGLITCHAGIQSSVTGKIEKINANIEYANWPNFWEKQSNDPAKIHPEENILFYIRPTKDFEEAARINARKTCQREDDYEILASYYIHLTNYGFLAPLPTDSNSVFNWKHNAEQYGSIFLPFKANFNHSDLNMLSNAKPNVVYDTNTPSL
jgi:hypothetical protein